MKRILYLFVCLFVFVVGFPFIVAAQQEVKPENTGVETHVDSRNFSSPMTVLDSVKGNANKNRSEEVQKTKLDNTTSRYCNELGVSVESNFTITKTLCNIKMNISSYLEYLIYIGLTAATIFIIRNGFQLVTSPDRGKQIGVFKKNIIYIVVGVILLISFYYIIDIFVSMVKLVAE